MKTLLSVLVLVSASVSRLSADASSLSGKWQLHTNAGGRESDYACTFTQKDSDLTGSCSPERGPVQINGKVEGKKVTWTYKTTYDGSPLTVTFRGTADSNKITGSVVAEEYGVEGDFSATQAEQ